MNVIGKIEKSLPKTDFISCVTHRLEYKQDFDGNYQPEKEVYEEIESLDNDEVKELLQLAKLGQAALMAIQNESRQLTSTVCKRLPPEISCEYCGSPICKWQDFCKLRSELTP